MRRSCGCLCADEVIAVVKIGCVLAAPYLAKPSHTHCLAWYRVRACSDDASAQRPGVLDARPKYRPDYDVRSVVYRRAHGSAHFHAADLSRRLGGARRSHGGSPARPRRPYGGGLAVLHPVWTVRRDRDAARGDFLGFNKKAIDGWRKSVTIHLVRDGRALTRMIGESGFGVEAAVTAQLWTHPSRCRSSSRLITSGHRLILLDHLPQLPCLSADTD